MLRRISAAIRGTFAQEDPLWLTAILDVVTFSFNPCVLHHMWIFVSSKWYMLMFLWCIHAGWIIINVFLLFLYLFFVSYDPFNLSIFFIGWLFEKDFSVYGSKTENGSWSGKGKAYNLVMTLFMFWVNTVLMDKNFMHFIHITSRDFWLTRAVFVFIALFYSWKNSTCFFSC